MAGYCRGHDLSLYLRVYFGFIYVSHVYIIYCIYVYSIKGMMTRQMRRSLVLKVGSGTHRGP